MGSFISSEAHTPLKQSSAEHFRACNGCYEWNYKRGVRCGYPPCCIESFASHLAGIPITEIERKASNYNFIPCRNHSMEIVNGTITIEELISRRSLPYKINESANIEYQD